VGDGGVLGGNKGKQLDVGGKVVVEVPVANKVYVPKYFSTEHDVTWASRGVVVSVLNRDAIPVVQRRIFDAGFDKLNIIPLGTDKVFSTTDNGEDVSFIISQAAEFFENFFTSPIKWNKNFVVRERGAWVRIYGVPLHTWNLDFFKLCVYDCSRLLRLDDLTDDKGRLDYARVLISTSSLDITKADATIMVDGEIFDFQIIEEGGFSLGEDACLSDDEESHSDDVSNHDDGVEELANRGDVDQLLNDVFEEWHKDNSERQMQCNMSHSASEMNKEKAPS